MKAALLEVTSGMPRFYPTILALILFGGRALAQAPTAAPPSAAPAERRPPLGATFTVDPLGTLPASESIFSLLDTVVADTIVDRIEPGDSNPGTAARVGAHGSTWTQTTFRVGDVDITNPAGTGAPLLIPGVEQWERVDVATGLMTIDAPAPGVAVSLMPRHPASQEWMRSLQFIGSPPAFNAGSPGVAAADLARQLMAERRPVPQRTADPREARRAGVRVMDTRHPLRSRRSHHARCQPGIRVCESREHADQGRRGPPDRLGAGGARRCRERPSVRAAETRDNTTAGSTCKPPGSVCSAAASRACVCSAPIPSAAGRSTCSRRESSPPTAFSAFRFPTCSTRASAPITTGRSVDG